MYFSPSIFTTCLTLLPLVGAAATNSTRTTVTPSGNSHSLPESYHFDPRDGWESVVVTNLRYKYRRSPTPSLGTPSVTSPSKNANSVLRRPSRASTEHPSRKSFLRSVGDSLSELTKSIIASGKPEPVTLTWYTGHDLLNPSCWTESKWAPTDQSFVAALTLDGWLGKPKCFKFLELCKNNTKCTFVRVVDTCAGCEKGTKHVDVTQAAFQSLGPLKDGVMEVWMREASNPTNWDMALWGPKEV